MSRDVGRLRPPRTRQPAAGASGIAEIAGDRVCRLMALACATACPYCGGEVGPRRRGSTRRGGRASVSEFRTTQRPWPRRPLGSDDRRRLRARAYVGVAPTVALVLLPGALGAVGWMVGMLAAWSLSRSGVTADTAPRVGLACFAVLGVLIDVVAARILLRDGSLERADLAEGEAEVVELTAQRVVDLGTRQHPALVFDSGDGRMLFVAGPSLAELLAPAGDNFPCSKVSVTRAPRSGVVLKIETGGQPLKPEKGHRPTGMRLRMLEWRESEVLVGSIT